jgi:transposase InsO family protein
MELGDQADRVKFMMRDRGSNFTTAFDAVLSDAGIQTVLCNVRTPHMNAIVERWIGGCRRELLDRTLIWNQSHLRRILREYETHHNQHRPHRFRHGAAPLKPLPEPVNLGQYRVRNTLTPVAWSGSRGHLSPRLPQIPYVSLSAYTALAILITRRAGQKEPISSARTCWDIFR